MQESLIGDRYQLTAPIARGAMSAVYSAHDRVLDREVAIKFLIGDGSGDASDRAEREMRLGASVDHPGLVEMLDAGYAAWRGSRIRFLVLERLNAPSLQQLLQTAPPSAALIAEIGEQVADALACLHQRGVLHLDVKPANIMVERVPTLRYSRRVRLIDFGLAERIDGIPHRPTPTAIATAGYLSPEHVAGIPLTGASDVYSLGLVLLRCLTGHDEYEGTAADAALARLSRDPRVPLDVPEGFASILSAMTDRTPEWRPRAEDVADAFSVLRPVDSRARVDGRRAPSSPMTRLRSLMHGTRSAGASSSLPIAV